MICPDTPASDFCYAGSELELFGQAINWKSYLRSRIAPYLGLDVLEVGAGFGGSTRMLAVGHHERWICVEPDRLLLERLIRSIESTELPSYCQSVAGTIDAIGEDARYDTILYLDVLEHIEDDRAEIEKARTRLKPGGNLVVLCPAHQWLFSSFDKSIGHYRRYTARTFRRLQCPGLNLVRTEYLDSCGLLASMANRLLLRQAKPTLSQIRVWDRLMVPNSRWLDPILGRRIGKSILGIWRSPELPGTELE